MPSISNAIRTRLLKTVSKNGMDVSIYTGYVDLEWTYDGYPHGGLVLGITVDSAIKFQASTLAQKDIIQISVHFLALLEVGPCTVHVQRIEAGKSFHNVEAEFVQGDKVKLKAMLLFGTLKEVTIPSDPQVVEDKFNIPRSSPLATRIPLDLHPSKAKLADTIPQANFKGRMQWSFEKSPFDRNRRKWIRGTSGKTTEECPQGLEWAAWFDWTDKEVVIDAVVLSFFGDVFQRLPDLAAWAKLDSPGSVSYSYTTLALNMEFKARIPVSNANYSTRTVGLYSYGKFMNDGLHDGCVEVWTAPSSIGEGIEKEGWRDEQVCLAVASQLTLAFPIGKKYAGVKRPQRGSKL